MSAAPLKPSYGAEYQHESTSFGLALLLATERLKVIAAVHPGLWHPGVLAKFGATADHLSNGRFAVNVVSGWVKGESTALGEPWLEHDELPQSSASLEPGTPSAAPRSSSAPCARSGPRTTPNSPVTSTGCVTSPFWRDIRTHTLHDPVAYKRREVGRWVLEGELPEPTWYS